MNVFLNLSTNLLFFLGDHTEILSTLFIIFLAAKLSAEVFERLKQPAVVGEILAGVLIGPSLLVLVKPTDLTKTLAEVGVILLLFTVGLEIKPKALFQVGSRALLVAVLGVIIPFFAGWLLLTLWGEPTIEGIFLGAAMVATSVGITARVLASLNVLNTQTSQIIMAAAVIDDILGLLVLSMVSSMAKGSVNYKELALSASLSIGFTLFMVFVGAKIVNKTRPTVEKLKIGNAFFIVGLTLCLGLSFLASYVGVAAIIGSFLAGMALSEFSEDTDLHHKSGAVMEFLLPFFLVGIGMQLELAVFKDPRVIILALLATLIAVITKLIGCGIAALPLGRKQALQIGMGMVPRGEVGIIVAQIGLGLGVMSNTLYGVVVFMAVATTLIAPPFLIVLFKETRNELAKEEEEIVDSDKTLSVME
ncbi:MAG: cation:proton antiporter [Acidobacteria bacterium]|nr:cation:proton antiporter [Acidobacteriota bacterium]